jgi:hypothetical protein
MASRMTQRAISTAAVRAPAVSTAIRATVGTIALAPIAPRSSFLNSVTHARRVNSMGRIRMVPASATVRCRGKRSATRLLRRPRSPIAVISQTARTVSAMASLAKPAARRVEQPRQCDGQGHCCRAEARLPTTLRRWNGTLKEPRSTRLSCVDRLAIYVF